ncbi:MAG: CPBP family intramembrane metalloprotease [Cyclobacteriaceae bacterium]|nr:CPBP family intramembrane metalloprotease [Cyclobacteriaceae bacterium]
MNNPSTTPFAPHIGPWKLLIISLVGSLLGFQLIGIFIGALVALPFYDGSVIDLFTAMADPVNNPSIKIPLMITQGVGSAFGMILVPWLMYRGVFKLPLQFGQAKVALQPAIITFLITLFFMVVNSPIGEWNQQIRLPEAFSGIESALLLMEENMKVITEFLIDFDSFGSFLLGLVVIAVVPAIGEELVFRGLIQNHLFRISGNIHVAIWVGAFIFGAIHMQFYGLFPRMMLGGLFGYLYYFSGKLSYAMIAHFFNNGIAVVAVYMHQLGKIEYDIEANEPILWYQVLISAVVLILLLFTFKKTASKGGKFEQVD